MLRRQIVELPSLYTRLAFADARSASGNGILHLQLRPYSNSNDVPQPSEPSQPSTSGYIYEAPFSDAVRKVKRLSLFSCACAVSACPLILYLDTGSSITAKASIAATLGGFGIFTTGLLHWFTSPYVHRLEHLPKEDAIKVNSLDMLGRRKQRNIPLGEVSEAQSVHPLSSFAAGGKLYYVDADRFQDKDLLARMVPSTAVVPEPVSQDSKWEDD